MSPWRKNQGEKKVHISGLEKENGTGSCYGGISANSDVDQDVCVFLLSFSCSFLKKDSIWMIGFNFEDECR